MKRIAWLCLVVAVAVRSGGLSAQSKPPDFSGTWVQNMEKSSIPASSPLQAYTNEIEQAGDNLKVVTILRRAGQDTRSQRTYVIGTEESHGILAMPQVRDKDAGAGALLMAELALDLKRRGRTVLDALG